MTVFQLSLTPADRVALADLGQRVTAWATNHIPASTVDSVRRHLLAECRELQAAPNDPREAADVLLLLLDLAERLGFNLADSIEPTFSMANHNVPSKLVELARGMVARAGNPAFIDTLDCGVMASRLLAWMEMHSMDWREVCEAKFAEVQTRRYEQSANEDGYFRHTESST